MNSGGCGSLGMGNGTQTVAGSNNSENWHSIQGYFYEFVMEVSITVTSTKKANGEEVAGSKLWENMALYGC